MKLYAEYIKEREDKECVYTDGCFLTYKKLNEKTIFVFDIFSEKQLRGSGVMLEFCNDFYKKQKEDGISIVYGMTDKTTNGWENSHRLLQKFGFKYMGIDPKDENINNYYMEL